MKNRIRDTLNKYRDYVDYLEIRIEKGEKLNVSFVGKILRTLNRNVEMGCAIRACYKGGWGFCSVVDLDKMDEMTELVIQQAKLAKKDKTILADVKPSEDDLRVSLIDDPRNYPISEKIDILKEYADIVMNFDPTIKTSNIYFDEEFKEVWFGNSEGSSIFQEKMDIEFAININAQKNGVVQVAHVVDGSSDNYGIIKNRHNEVEENCKLVLDLVEAPPVKGGIYPVIVNPMLGGTFVHEAYGHTSEADYYMDNEQIKIQFPFGKVLGSPILSIYDTGLDKGSRGFLVYDDEGTKCEKSYLIKNGVLVGRLHNRESAAKFGEKPTGSARAMDFRFPPICRMRNTAIEGGISSFEELLDGIKLGVYAIDGLGGVTSGEQFSFGALYGYMIRDGKLAELVRDVSLTGNLFDTLKNIDAIGNDYKIMDGPGGCGKDNQFPLPVTGSSPHFRIKKITVGGEQ